MSAPEARGGRLAGAALRCYPARWRRRHADEAAELAALLIADGTPAVSIAWSYLLGAAREWLAPRPGRSLSTVAAALLAATCLLGSSAVLIAESAPAKAAGRTQCRPVLPGQVSGAFPAASHSRLSIQGTAHVRSC
jgi:hypothetical protein